MGTLQVKFSFTFGGHGNWFYHFYPERLNDGLVSHIIFQVWTPDFNKKRTESIAGREYNCSRNAFAMQEIFLSPAGKARNIILIVPAMFCP